MPFLIDAGIENIRLRDSKEVTIPSNDKIDILFDKHNIFEKAKAYKDDILITGKLADVVQEKIGGKTLLPGAVLWALSQKFAKTLNSSIGVIELSASGYGVICVDNTGALLNDFLIVNPKCGAGCGINLKRILEKLGVDLTEVDTILKDYLGKEGKEKRKNVTVRADRCGVFSSSATISDKNQGIPLDYALATTMKSEVLKACRRILNVDKIMLTGGVFQWQFMRDCAKDFLAEKGMLDVDYNESLMLDGMQDLYDALNGKIRDQGEKLARPQNLPELPAFSDLMARYTKNGLYKRFPNDTQKQLEKGTFNESTAVNIALDVGSTMAKIILADVDDTILFTGSYTNHGDTVQTIKHIFCELRDQGIQQLNIQHIGITGSGRYQVKKVLEKVYPSLGERVFALVENYAHARGSINFVKEHLEQNKKLNHDFCVLVDIGGEDTKVSIISLTQEELFDNVMNIKCSAGTGSLMDTLKALFNIQDIGQACQAAYSSDKAYEINATCAVFLMENAKKMQAQGYSKKEILASCNHAIVENMARTLWNQIDFPDNAIVLLHGQTMLSDPLPLAVTHRLQEFSKMYCLIPPMPGHRACIGLLKSIEDDAVIENPCELKKFIDVEFEKTIFFCRGIACGDKNSRCARTRLKSTSNEAKLSISLGGCTAINELSNSKKQKIPNAYKEIWELMDARLPRSKEKNRLVIPRCFAVSENALFLAGIFEELGIPTHVDNVNEQDILLGQSQFSVDVCAPLIGATGQYSRLATEPHGIILALQIDFLPTDGKSMGRTCTVNQGGPVIARKYAEITSPKARFVDLSLNLSKLDAEEIAGQLHDSLQSVFSHYALSPDKTELINAVNAAMERNARLKAELAEKAAEFIDYAIDNKLNISIACAREYILNPGIYDSHIGRLLRDKGVIALPSYVFESELDIDFGYVYWRNPHMIISLIKAFTDKRIHKVLKNDRLKASIEKIEKGLTESLISTIQVSTFRCGPDSVTMPTINEITKNVPTLFIQSDAMIKELAHLENRVNTHLNQLTKRLNEQFNQEKFSIEQINGMGIGKVNKETDVVYIPNMHDNRSISASIRASGITTIDNFLDESYDIEKKVRIGRKYTGDSVCAPLAAVFADIVLSFEDFERRKKANDPLVKGKSRVLVFDNKGTGPCRQGQYFEQHKLLAFNKLKNNTMLDSFKILVAQEEDGFDVGLEDWTQVLVYQGLALQGVLLSLLLKSSHCKDYAEFQQFHKEYVELKTKLFDMLESSKPGKTALQAVKISEKAGLGKLGKYFAYGVYNNNGLKKPLKEFAKKWVRNSDMKINIHVSGEVYMRVALVEDLFREVVDSIGFGTFEMTYSSSWSTLDMIAEYELINYADTIKGLTWKNPDDPEIKKKKKSLKQLTNVISSFRELLAKPLYEAAGIELPEKMSDIMSHSRDFFPSMKPQSELPAYVGEAVHKLAEGVDLVLNIAPEGCQVSSMEQAMHRPILHQTGSASRLQGLNSQNGEVDVDQLNLALLKTLGPEQYYSTESS